MAMTLLPTLDERSLSKQLTDLISLYKKKTHRSLVSTISTIKWNKTETGFCDADATINVDGNELIITPSELIISLSFYLEDVTHSKELKKIVDILIENSETCQKLLKDYELNNQKSKKYNDFLIKLPSIAQWCAEQDQRKTCLTAIPLENFTSRINVLKKYTCNENLQKWLTNDKHFQQLIQKLNQLEKNIHSTKRIHYENEAKFNLELNELEHTLISMIHKESEEWFDALSKRVLHFETNGDSIENINELFDNQIPQIEARNDLLQQLKNDYPIQTTKTDKHSPFRKNIINQASQEKHWLHQVFIKYNTHSFNKLIRKFLEYICPGITKQIQQNIKQTDRTILEKNFFSENSNNVKNIVTQWNDAKNTLMHDSLFRLHKENGYPFIPKKSNKNKDTWVLQPTSYAKLTSH